MFSTLSGIFQNFCLQHILQPQSQVTWWVGGGFTLFCFFKYRQPTTSLWPWACDASADGGCTCSTEIQVVAPLCLDKKNLNIISECTFHCSWYYLVSYSRMTEINERQTCADYFCIFPGRSLQKSWSQVQLPWAARGLPDKQNCGIDFSTQSRSSRGSCFVLLLKNR